MKIVNRVNPNHILVKYNTGVYQHRVQTKLNFQAEYVDALRSALNLVRSGATQVEVIQYREQLHSHHELKHAATHLGRYATDEEVIEAVHNSTFKPQNVNLLRLLSSPGCTLATIWAVAS